MVDEFNSNKNNFLNERNIKNTVSMANEEFKSGYQRQLAQDLSSGERMEFQSSVDSSGNAAGYPAHYPTNQVITEF